MKLNMKRLQPWSWFKQENGGGGLPSTRYERSPNMGVYFPQFGSLHEEIDRIFTHALRNLEFLTSEADTSDNPNKGNTFKPKINIDSTDKEYRISVEIPGVEEKDMKIEISPEGNLTIRGEKNKEKQEKDRNYYCAERSYGSFERTLSLPEDADQGDISAHFKNGVLTVTVPRKELPQSQTRQIPIETTGNEN